MKKNHSLLAIIISILAVCIIILSNYFSPSSVSYRKLEKVDIGQVWRMAFEDAEPSIDSFIIYKVVTNEINGLIYYDEYSQYKFKDGTSSDIEIFREDEYIHYFFFFTEASLIK